MNTVKGGYDYRCKDCVNYVRNQSRKKNKPTKGDSATYPSEIWEDIDNYIGYYQISNYGRVRSLARRVWSNQNGGCYINREGYIFTSPRPSQIYAQYSFTKDGVPKCHKVHRLVATAFIPNPNNLPQVNHIDGNKQNNNISNLEWCTASENAIHAFKNGLSVPKRGIESSKCKFTRLDIESIKRLGKTTQRKVIAQMFSVDKRMVYKVLAGGYD